MLNIDDRIVKDGLLKEMGAPAWSVLTAICIHLNGSNQAWPGQKRLQGLTGLGRDTVLKAIKKLKKMGILSATQRIGEDGRKGSNLYRLHTDYISVFISVSKLELLEELPATENQYTVQPSPATEKPYTVKPATVNQYPLSINQSLSINKDISINKDTHTKENFEKDILEVEKAFKDFTGIEDSTAAENLPPEEKTIIEAIDKFKKYFEQWPDMVRKLTRDAKITDVDFNIYDEGAKWIRHNCKKTFLISNLEKEISSSFGMWLMSYRPKKNNNYGSTTNNKNGRPNRPVQTKQERNQIFSESASLERAAAKFRPKLAE